MIFNRSRCGLLRAVRPAEESITFPLHRWEIFKGVAAVGNGLLAGGHGSGIGSRAVSVEIQLVDVVIVMDIVGLGVFIDHYLAVISVSKLGIGYDDVAFLHINAPIREIHGIRIITYGVVCICLMLAVQIYLHIPHFFAVAGGSIIRCLIDLMNGTERLICQGYFERKCAEEVAREIFD